MFRVHGHEFDIDSESASLDAFIGPEDGALCTSWSLAIRAIRRTITFPNEESPVKLAPRIQLDSLQFAVTDWRRLADSRHSLPTDINGSWLLVSEWEPFTHLDLAFGAVCDDSIAVELNGVGLHESWPELLGSEVPFSVSASLVFGGVGLRTNPNVTDPTSHARTRLRHFLPDYRFAPPRVEELRHEGGYYGCHVHFPPAPSA